MEALDRESPATTAEQTELERLQARVEQLETELAQQAVRTNTIVARTQDRVYWLDRWHLDLNALMRRRGAAEFRASVRAIRAVFWRVKRTKRRLVG